MSLVGNRMRLEDALSAVLRSVRIEGCVQFCFFASGAWQADADEIFWARGNAVQLIPFHIIASGECWLKFDGAEIWLTAGDVIAFPHGSTHVLGAGRMGPTLDPLGDLPDAPWQGVPVLNYGEGEEQVRVVCGFLECDAMAFAPISCAVPRLLHARGTDAGAAIWVAEVVKQIVAEVDGRSVGGQPVLERLTEILFLELLRGEVSAVDDLPTGWIAAMRDPAMGRSLAAIHADPKRDWTVEDIADIAGISRSALVDNFKRKLGVAPIRYLRDWRLHLATLRIRAGTMPISKVAFDAGYASEAAFNRAFKTAYGLPPVAWRAKAVRQIV
jgi:AraC-like DNA-binding protein